jgi:hypothetical protein
MAVPEPIEAPAPTCRQSTRMTQQSEMAVGRCMGLETMEACTDPKPENCTCIRDFIEGPVKRERRLERRISSLGEEVGDGLFATTRLQDKMAIARYIGKVSKRKPKRASGFIYKFRHLQAYIVPDKTTKAAYINHCCRGPKSKPNVGFEEWKDEHGKAHVLVVTRRAIERGEELFVDYGNEREQFDCLCRNCKDY